MVEIKIEGTLSEIYSVECSDCGKNLKSKLYNSTIIIEFCSHCSDEKFNEGKLAGIDFVSSQL